MAKGTRPSQLLSRFEDQAATILISPVEPDTFGLIKKHMYS